MRVLVGCEVSGTVRDAFILKGHDAWSCDIWAPEDLPLPLPQMFPERHYKMNVLMLLDKKWDLAIFHPPCTRLCSSGAAWHRYYRKEQEASLNFVRELLNAPIPKIALENPIGVISTRIRPPDQIVQPWWFGDEQSKATCLWLENLPKLTPTNIVEKHEEKSYKMSPSITRGMKRSITPLGMANAMAEQWGTCAF